MRREDEYGVGLELERLSWWVRRVSHLLHWFLCGTLKVELKAAVGLCASHEYAEYAQKSAFYLQGLYSTILSCQSTTVCHSDYP